MFRSKQREIIIPQFEHARLSAMVAMLWGNATFTRPVFDFDSFITGVMFHDRGFGRLDNYSLGEMTKHERRVTLLAGIEEEFANPIADLVVLFHVRRLISWLPADFPCQDIVAKAEQRIRTQLNNCSFSYQDFAFADRITCLCDFIAFDFSFEKPGNKTTAILPYPQANQEIAVEYSIEQQNIFLKPFPLKQEYQGFIIGYHAPNYPQTLEPVVVPFFLKQG